MKRIQLTFRSFVSVLVSALLCLEWGPAVFASDRPSVLVTPDDIIRLREEIRTIPWKRAIYEGTPQTGSKDAYARWQERQTFLGGGGIKANADKWLRADIEIPARSGHFHNFFCECGSQLLLPEGNKPDPNGYKCSSCGKVYKGEKYDGAVRWQIHNELAVGCFHLAFVYAIEGDIRYAEKACEILLKYAEAYPGPHTSTTEGGIMYQSLCESVWVIPLAYAYDLVCDSGVLSVDERDRIEKKLFRPVAEGLMNMGIGGNWGSWHLSAVGVIGYSIRDKRLVQYAVDSFKSQIANQLGDDGLWPESVHTYHFYPLNAFLYLAEAAFNNGLDLYHWEAKPGKSLKSMFIAPLSYMYPNQQLPAINDGWFKSYLPLSQYELAYARTGDPVIEWALKVGYEQRNAPRAGLWALLQGKTLDGSKEPALRSVNFPVLGIAVLRSSNGSVLTFDYGPYLGHGQPDKMGITLFANGRLLVADYGTSGYGSPFLAWQRSTMSHNTVVVDGVSQKPTKERRLTVFHADQTFEATEAETEEAYPGVLHRRTVLRVDDYFIVLDSLESSVEHSYDWFLHCEGKLSLQAGKPDGRHEGLDYEYIDEKASYSPQGSWSAEWSLDGAGLLLSMPMDSDGVVYSAECPAETMARKVPLLIVRKTGKSAEFVSVLYPHAGESSAKISAEHGLVVVDHDGVKDYIFVGKPDPESPLVTDGRFALVRTKASAPFAASVVRGTFVSWKGKTVRIAMDSDDPKR